MTVCNCNKMPFHSLIDAVLKLPQVKVDAYYKFMTGHFRVIHDFCASKPGVPGQLKALMSVLKMTFCLVFIPIVFQSFVFILITQLERGKTRA